MSKSNVPVFSDSRGRVTPWRPYQTARRWMDTGRHGLGCTVHQQGVTNDTRHSCLETYVRHRTMALDLTWFEVLIQLSSGLPKLSKRRTFVDYWRRDFYKPDDLSVTVTHPTVSKTDETLYPQNCREIVLTGPVLLTSAFASSFLVINIHIGSGDLLGRGWRGCGGQEELEEPCRPMRVWCGMHQEPGIHSSAKMTNKFNTSVKFYWYSVITVNFNIFSKNNVASLL